MDFASKFPLRPLLVADRGCRMLGRAPAEDQARHVEGGGRGAAHRGRGVLLGVCCRGVAEKSAG